MQEGFCSKAFTNLLCVINKTKLQAFLAETGNLMNEYYTTLNASELKRHADQAKAMFHEIRERPAADVNQFA